LFGCGLVCIALKPKGLAADDGLSYYGTFWQTLLPYAAAVLGSSFFIFRAAQSIAPSSPYLQYIKTALSSLILFATGIVLTPYSLNRIVAIVHALLGTLLFTTQFVVAVWLAWQFRRDFINIACFLLLLISGIASAIYLPSKHHGFLIQGQALFQVWFSIIVLRTIAHLLPPRQETSSI